MILRFSSLSDQTLTEVLIRMTCLVTLNSGIPTVLFSTRHIGLSLITATLLSHMNIATYFIAVFPDKHASLVYKYQYSYCCINYDMIWVEGGGRASSERNP